MHQMLEGKLWIHYSSWIFARSYFSRIKLNHGFSVVRKGVAVENSKLFLQSVTGNSSSSSILNFKTKLPHNESYVFLCSNSACTYIKPWAQTPIWCKRISYLHWDGWGASTGHVQLTSHPFQGECVAIIRWWLDEFRNRGRKSQHAELYQFLQSFWRGRSLISNAKFVNII